MKLIGVYFVCFIIFCGWLFYEQRKASRKEKKISDDFWAREAKANNTRKKDISHLPLLAITEEELPIGDSTDESVLYYIDHLRKQIKMPMMDLSAYSNTDLKLAYGVGNFQILSEYDENYNTFLLTLSNLGRAYARAGNFACAKDTYLLALQYGSMKLSDYTDLAHVYLQLKEPQSITSLIQNVDSSEHPRKKSIIENLQHIQNQYH